MNPRVVSVKVIQNYQVELAWTNGDTTVVDLAYMIQPGRGVFAPMAEDYEEFKKIWVDPELKTIAWPNGADLDPDVLYRRGTTQYAESKAEQQDTEQPQPTELFIRPENWKPGAAHTCERCGHVSVSAWPVYVSHAGDIAYWLCIPHWNMRAEELERC